ncbi:MAG: hypothetical protein E4H09_03645 [Spirochaetales bacterium]|nr:MAG: hypothetical protein E4H09_03645 [Spirochaetales bacterium]
MMFGFFPFFFIFPLIFVFVVARVAARFIRGGQRTNSLMRNHFEVPPIQGPPATRIAHGPSQEAQVFKLAYKLNGRITLSDIVVETNMGIRESETLIESMVDTSHVRMEVDPATGIVTYEFPEIIRRLEEGR